MRVNREKTGGALLFILYAAVFLDGIKGSILLD
jgi:hypothetical protein